MTMKAGEYKIKAGDMALNAGRCVQTVEVVNTGDRPIQVGSHYHFYEVNDALSFDRESTLGYRLNIIPGTAVRFEPGQSREVELVAIAGKQHIYGFAGKVMGPADIKTTSTTSQKRVDRRIHAEHFGPTTGDKVRLADTNLWLEVEYDLTSHIDHYLDSDETHSMSSNVQEIEISGSDHRVKPKNDLGTDSSTTTDAKTDHAPAEAASTQSIFKKSPHPYTREVSIGEEVKFGGGKVIRDGMGQSQLLGSQVADTIITNALIVDYTGIYKADVALKDGRISGIGKAGNPDIQPDVTLPIGAATEIIAGEGKILTAGGIDSHIHFIAPQQCETALMSGVTTMLGGGTGPAEGTLATTCTPGIYHIQSMLKATDGIPINIGLLGKGNVSLPEPIIEQVEAGAIGLKIHEDWGATPQAIDNCLSVAEEYDVQVAIHTDTLNESGYLESTLNAFKDRCIHTFHTEGAGGGHAPDILKAIGVPHVLPSSTNPTRPFTVNTIDEHLDMLMVCHHLSPAIAEDVAFAESRIRKETIAAEDMLQDMGAISMMSSDSQAMGRVGEVIIRTWQTADKMKAQRGHLAPDPSAKTEQSAEHILLSNADFDKENDNFRIKRYISKYTINPAITHGISDQVGSVEVGKWADLVLWSPVFFGVKPDCIIKGGLIAAAPMGDPNASIATPQPVHYRSMFASFPKTVAQTCITFMSRSAIDKGVDKQLGLEKVIKPVHNIRDVRKQNMKFNSYCPDMAVNPETYEVHADGELLTCEPVDYLPMAQRYFLF